MSSLKGSVSSSQNLNGGSAINVAVTPNITIGTVTTLEPGANVIVELDESSTRINPVFNFGIPEGKEGKKGEAGSIKFIIVNELPTENIDKNAMYLKKIVTEEEQNTYQEYIYVNDTWELVGTAKVQVDLTDYVKNTDYGTSTKAGVVKNGGPTTGIQINANGFLYIEPATNTDIAQKTSHRKPIVPVNLDVAVGSVLPVITQAEYDALETKDENLYYFITEE